MEQIWTQVGNYGFPMDITFFLLIRIEKKLDALTTAISNLAQTLAK